MKTQRYAALTSLVLLGLNCKNDPEPAGLNACAVADERRTAIGPAANAYAVNPSKANCEAYRKAAGDYLEIARRCPTVSAADTTSARSAYNALNCQ